MARVFMSKEEAELVLEALEEYAAKSSPSDACSCGKVIERVENCILLQGKKKTAIREDSGNT